VPGKSCGGNRNRRRFTLRLFPSLFFMALLVILSAETITAAEQPNRLHRMEVSSRARYTRLLLVFDRAPQYSFAYLPGRRVQLTFLETGGAALRKYNAFSDSRVSDVSLLDRGNRLRLRFSLKETAPGIRVLDSILPNVVTVDVGESLQLNGAASMPAGRERIWSGVGKVIQEFDPPLTSGLPFFPTPGSLLKKMLSPADVKLYFRGEDALYRERGVDAEEVFSSLVNQGGAVRGMAAFRLGEAQYLLQKYESALQWFREGERLQPEYMFQSPSIVFSYADTLARRGEIAAGRKMLERLAVGMADTKYGPLLLVRMADVMLRGGRGMDAIAIYRTVMENFPATRGGVMASLRLADRRFFQVSADTYQGLSAEYRKISSNSGDPSIKEEALFKGALLDTLYAPESDAVVSVADYEKKYPSGIFANVARTLREDLLPLLYRKLNAANDCRGITRLVLDNKEYLSRCTSEPGFLRRTDDCFRSEGIISEGLELFSMLVETEWAAGQAPFLYYRIFDVSLELGDLARAEAAGKVFILRFPQDPNSGNVRERLAAIQFRNRDFRAVLTTLSPLMAGKGGMSYPDSYYYFGKACASLDDPAGAEKAMLRYLAVIGEGKASVMASDARVVAASSRQSRGDLRGAMELCRSGYEAASPEQKEMFLYKMGDLARRSGRHDEARSYWELLLRDGKDPVWKRLASQALSDMEWADKWRPHATSK